jgi:hypothetical protein
MARLPVPGADNGIWGTILNDFLAQAHNADGTLKPLTQSQITNLLSDLAAKVNSADLAAVAISGSYGDLSNKPTILALGTTSTTAKAGNYMPSIADLPSGSTITVLKSSNTWPIRPTARTDIIVQWKGADPSPVIVSSGTGGMLDNVDIRFVTP